MGQTQQRRLTSDSQNCEQNRVAEALETVTESIAVCPRFTVTNSTRGPCPEDHSQSCYDEHKEGNHLENGGEVFEPSKDLAGETEDDGHAQKKHGH